MKWFPKVFLALTGVALSMAALPLSSQHCPPAIEWVSDVDYGIATVQIMADGGFFLSVGGDEQLGFIRTDAAGNVLWFSPAYSLPSAVFETDNGDVVVGVDYSIMRLDRAGQVVWTQSPPNALFFPRAIQQTPSGGFVVAGEIIPEVAIIELDAAGKIVSQRTITTFENYPKPLNIQPVKGGGYIVGSYAIVAGDYDVRLTRVDDAGNILWEHTYGGIGLDFLRSIEVTSDGGFIVGTSSYSAPGKQKESPFFGDGILQPGDYSEAGGDIWILRLDGNGNKVWDRSFGGNLGELTGKAKELPDHGVIIVGSSYSPGGTGNKTSPGFGDLDSWVVRTDSAGNKLWEQSYGTPEEEFLLDVQVAADGSLILAGSSLIKLQPEGLSDCDHDGVPDGADDCLDTPAGEPVDSHGCSIDQLVPCDGGWKDHGQYVKKFHDVAEEFLKRGYVNQAQFSTLLNRATHSQCGNGKNTTR